MRYRPEVADWLSAKIDDWFASHHAKVTTRDEAVPVDVLEGLRALGYMDGYEKAEDKETPP